MPTATSTPFGPPDLSIEKTLQGTLTTGQGGTYLIHVTNVGTGPTTGPITVMDPMPAGLTLVSASGSGWDCTASTPQNADCVFNGVLSPQESAPVITVRVAVQAGLQGGVSNVASVATESDAHSGNDSGTATAPITKTAPAPLLSAEGLAALLAVLLLVAAFGVWQLRAEMHDTGRSRRRE
jgi:uncharacterized repeat protein (TIGR01451 family)